MHVQQGRDLYMEREGTFCRAEDQSYMLVLYSRQDNVLIIYRSLTKSHREWEVGIAHRLCLKFAMGEFKVAW